MSQLPWVSPEKLKAQLHGMVDRLAQQIMEAMNAARPGSLINDTEEPVRQVGHEFLRASFEAALQQNIDAAEASFSPSGVHHNRPSHEAARHEKDASQRQTVAIDIDGQ